MSQDCVRFYPVHVLRRQKRKGRPCFYCGALGHTIDHVFPRSLGGGDETGNVVICCMECNQAKGDLTLSEFLQMPENRARNRARIAMIVGGGSVTRTEHEDSALWATLRDRGFTVYRGNGGFFWRSELLEDEPMVVGPFAIRLHAVLDCIRAAEAVWMAVA